jgi:hypothetical protein
MLRLRVRTERQPRLKNGQPAHKTTGVLRANWIQRDASPESQAGAFGKRCDMARRKTGNVSAVPIQKRRVMSINSASSGGLLAEIVFGSSAIPQIGQSPGWSRSISGCIGQV